MSTLSNSATIAVAALITQAAVRPGLARYSAWKRDLSRVQTFSRDISGQYVPDLWIKRGERAFWVALALFSGFGLMVLYTILTTPPDTLHPPPVVTVRTVSPR